MIVQQSRIASGDSLKMAFPASSRHLQRYQKTSNFLAQWKHVIFLLPIGSLITHVDGAPNPMYDVPHAALGAGGVKGFHEADGLNAGVGEAKTMGDMMPSSDLYSEHSPSVDSYPDSPSLEDHSSLSEESKFENDEYHDVAIAEAEAAITAKFGHIDKTLDSLTKNVKALKDQDSHLLGLRLLSTDVDKAAETIQLDYRAVLVREMKLHGSNAKKWLEKLPVPLGVPRHIKDGWSDLKFGALEDYKIYQKGSYRNKQVARLHNLIGLSKWKGLKLDQSFLKIRMSKGFQRSKHRLIMLELDSVRKAGITLSKEETQLVHRIVEAGGDESKLTATELQLLTKLSGKTVTQRRFDMLSTLRLHIEQLSLPSVGSVEVAVKNAQISDMKAALAALQSYTEKGIDWKREHTQLVVALGRVKNIDQLEKALSDAEKTALHFLAHEQTQILRVERYDKALHRLAMKPSLPHYSEEVRLEVMLHQFLDGARRSPTASTEVKFSAQQEKQILELAGEYEIQMGTLKLHTNPQAIDTSHSVLSQYEVTVDKRAELALERMHKDGSISLEQTQLWIKLQGHPINPGSVNQKAQKLADKYLAAVGKKTEANKVKHILTFGQQILDHDIQLQQELSKISYPKDLINPRIVGEEKAKDLSAYLVGIYDTMVHSMSTEEKAFHYLGSIEKEALDGKEKEMLESLLQGNMLTLKERFLAVTYAKEYGVPTLEQLAQRRLSALKNLGAELTSYRKTLEAKLAKGQLLALSENEQTTMHQLALEYVVLEKSTLSSDGQKAVMAWIGQLKHDEDIGMYMGKVIKHMKSDEILKLYDLLAKNAKMAKEGWLTHYAHDPKIMEMIQLTQQAEKRMNLESKNIDIKQVESLLQSQHKIRSKEIAQLKQKIQKKSEVLQSYAEVLKSKDILTQPENLELPEDLNQHIESRYFFQEPHTLQAFPQLDEKSSKALK